MEYVALYDYEARTESELDFHQNDRFRILNKANDEWWEAEMLPSGKRGWVPHNYVAPVQVRLQLQPRVALEVMRDARAAPMARTSPWKTNRGITARCHVLPRSIG